MSGEDGITPSGDPYSTYSRGMAWPAGTMPRGAPTVAPNMTSGAPMYPVSMGMLSMPGMWPTLMPEQMSGGMSTWPANDAAASSGRPGGDSANYSAPPPPPASLANYAQASFAQMQAPAMQRPQMNGAFYTGNTPFPNFSMIPMGIMPSLATANSASASSPPAVLATAVDDPQVALMNLLPNSMPNPSVAVGVVDPNITVPTAAIAKRHMRLSKRCVSADSSIPMGVNKDVLQHRPISTFDGGTSCHQCKSRRSAPQLAHCTKLYSKKTSHGETRLCHKKYCLHCLEKYYDEKEEYITANTNWMCPSCRAACTCAACKRTIDRRIERQARKAARLASNSGGHALVAAAAAVSAASHNVGSDDDEDDGSVDSADDHTELSSRNNPALNRRITGEQSYFQRRQQYQHQLQMQRQMVMIQRPEDAEALAAQHASYFPSHMMQNLAAYQQQMAMMQHFQQQQQQQQPQSQHFGTDAGAMMQAMPVDLNVPQFMFPTGMPGMMSYPTGTDMLFASGVPTGAQPLHSPTMPTTSVMMPVSTSPPPSGSPVSGTSSSLYSFVASSMMSNPSGTQTVAMAPFQAAAGAADAADGNSDDDHVNDNGGPRAKRARLDVARATRGADVAR